MAAALLELYRLAEAAIDAAPYLAHPLQAPAFVLVLAAAYAAFGAVNDAVTDALA